MRTPARVAWAIALAVVFAVIGLLLYRTGVSVVVIKLMALAAAPLIWLWLRRQAS